MKDTRTSRERNVLEEWSLRRQVVTGETSDRNTVLKVEELGLSGGTAVSPNPLLARAAR